MGGALRSSRWTKLDNAAKIFPSSSRKTDTSVFRFYCELKEQIEPEALQSATDRALKDYPHFKSVMRKGAFWYYLEATELKPEVQKEEGPLCSRIYDGEGSSLLFEVSYFQNRINLEIYHVLSDGTGALKFLKTVVYYYLKQAHEEELPQDLVFLENDASYTEKEADGFSKYYKKEKGKRPPSIQRPYRLPLKKNSEEELSTIEAIADLPGVLDAAHRNNTTLTAYLTALFIQSVYKEMSAQGKTKTIVIMVPVNLRQFFPTETARNFFGLVDICYDCQKGSGELDEMIQAVNTSLKGKLTAEYLAEKMNRFAAIEHNPFAKIAPLPLKNVVLRAARALESRKETAVISNVGKVTMPKEMHKYIDLFGVLASTRRLQLCMCSFGSKLQIGFTSAFNSTDIEKNFIRALTDQGVEITVRSNNFFKEETGKEG